MNLRGTRIPRSTLWVAALLALLIANPREGSPAAAQSPCPSPPCHRAYLPLVGGRLRVDLSEYGPGGPPWEHLGMSDRVLDLAYDQAGTLWAATLGGLVAWPADGSPPRVHTREPISQVAVDGEGGVWFGGAMAAGGVERVQADPLERLTPGGSRVTFAVADGLPEGWLQELAVDEGGRVFASWAAMGDPAEGPAGGLARWDPAGGWRVWPALAFTSGGAPWALCPDGQGGMWLAGGSVKVEGPDDSSAWLRRVDREGRLKELETLPAGFEGQAVFRLSAGLGGKLHAILGPLDKAAGLAGQALGGPVPGLESTLVIRSPTGDWTAIDLPLDLVDEARLEPQGFLSGPRDLAVDARGTVWLAWEGALMALAADGGMSLYPAPAADNPPDADLLALSEALLGEPALAPRPQGGLALGSRRARGVALLGRGTALDLRRGPNGIPARLSQLWSGALGFHAMGDDDGRRRLWWRGPAGSTQAIWSAIDRRIPDGGIGLWTLAAAADGSHWISDGEFLLHTDAGRQRLETFGPGRGLPGGAVTRIAQAPNGEIWVGTLNGLVRRELDGSWLRFSLPDRLSPTVSDIAVAEDGSAWIALAASDRESRILQGGLLFLGSDGRRSDWSSSEIVGLDEVEGTVAGQDQLAISPSGRVFTSGDFGVSSGDAAGVWESEPLLSSAGSSPMVFDRRGRLWTIDAENQVLRYEPTLQAVKVVDHPVSDTHLLWDLGMDPKSGDLLLLANDAEDVDSGAVILRLSERGAWTRIDVVDVAGRQWVHDRLHTIVAATDGTLLALSGEDRILLYGPAGIGAWEPQDRLTEGGSLTKDGCVDPSGRLWLPYRDGLSSFTEREGWRHLRSADGLPPQAEGGRVHCAPDGSIWLTHPATAGIPASVARWTRVGGLDPQEALLGLHPGEGLLRLAWSADGRLAALVNAGGHDSEPARALLISQPARGFRRHAPGVLAQAQTTELTWAPDGRLWIATDRGLAVLSPRDPAAQPAWEPSTVVAGRGLLDLAWRGGRLWAVGPEGAAERMEDGRWRPYTRADGLSRDRLRQVTSGPEGDLWLLNDAGTVDRLAP